MVVGNNLLVTVVAEYRDKLTNVLVKKGEFIPADSIIDCKFIFALREGDVW